MKIHRFLILVVAAAVGTMYYKYQRHQEESGESSSSGRGTYSTIAGHGSLMESMQGDSDDNEFQSSTMMSTQSRSPIGMIGNPYESSSSLGSMNRETPVSHLPKDDLPLLRAAAKGDKEGVEERLAAHVKVDSRDSRRRTPLMYAAYAGRDDISARLLAAGADANLEDRNGSNAFDYAAGRGLTGSVQFLLTYSHAEDDRHYIEYATLIQAVTAGDVSRLPEGKGRLAAVNRVNPDGQSLLQIAAGNGSVALAEELIKRGAQVNLANSEGQTPMHWAAWNNQPAMIELLAAKGADVSAGDLGGNTPLILAAENNNREAVLMLLAKGADKTIANKQKQTAAIIADDKGHKDLATMLW